MSIHLKKHILKFFAKSVGFPAGSVIVKNVVFLISLNLICQVFTRFVFVEFVFVGVHEVKIE